MTRLTILHTNDLHARIQQLPRIAALAKAIRREVTLAGGHCVLWDAGDAEDTTLFESSMTKGSAMLAMLRGAGYELEALGNASPLRYGPQCVKDLAERFGQPLLCANMIDPQTHTLVAGLRPYILLSAGDVKVGVIGLTDPMPTYRVFKLITPAPAEILPQLIEEVRARGAQTIVLLSHLSSKKDREVAERISGIDVIIGAHDHQAFDPPLIINGVIVAQAGDFGRFLGRLDLDLDPVTGRVVQHHGALIPITDELPIDPEAAAAIDAEREQVRQFTSRVIGSTHQALDVQHDRECVAGNVLADMLLDRLQAEIAITLSGHWQDTLPAGSITLGGLYAAVRSTANPGWALLTGEQILNFLRTAMKVENYSRTPTGLRGVPVGWPHVAGLRVIYAAAHLDSIEVWAGAEPLKPDRVYRVAGTDLEFSGFIGYLNLPDDQVEYELPTIVPEVLHEYIAAHSPIALPTQRFFRRD